MADVTTRAGKYITFQLSRQYFAIASDRVRQILPANDIQPANAAVSCLCGAIAANGRLIPVLDVRRKLGLSARPAPKTACVLVLEIDRGGPVKTVGVIADKLSEVVDYRTSEIHGTTVQQRVEGRPYGRPKTLLAPEHLLDPDEWLALKSVVL